MNLARDHFAMTLDEVSTKMTDLPVFESHVVTVRNQMG